LPHAANDKANTPAPNKPVIFLKFMFFFLPNFN
jgi:hypothetical protein